MQLQSDPIPNNISSSGHIWGWLILYMLWPFGALLKSFSWIRTKEAKNLFWLFCVYFGFTFVLQEGSNADSSRYVRNFVELSRSGISLNELLGTFYASGSTDLDVVESLITFIVSKFTSDYRFLYATFGLVFGYFYSRSIWLLLNKTNTRITIFSGLVLLGFVVTDGIWNINGFRYYTAAQVFMYGSLSYFLEGNKRKLWFAAAAILLHWSFLIALAVLLIYIILRNFSRVYFVLFIISFFLASLKLEIIRLWFESYAPALIVETRSGYLSSSYSEAIDKLNLAANWYIKGHLEAVKWFIFASFAFIYLRGFNKVRANKQLLALFNFSLLFYALVNIFSVVPSMVRFYDVANMLSLACIFLISANHTRELLSLAKKLRCAAIADFYNSET